ncbi:MAG: hypothetical protein ACRCSQ_02780 [Bacteroidales bacterium]
MKILFGILRILGTLILIELTFIAFNYFSAGGDFKYTWGMLDPREAIYNSIAYLNEVLHWSFFASYLSILLICTGLILFYYYLMMLLFRYREPIIESESESESGIKSESKEDENIK